ncbi:MAG: 50S ribosomal protein L10 [Patescibacteria group bacterium]
MATQKKIDTVTELTDRVHRAKSMVFVDYRGLKHKQLESLRKSLKTVNADLTITKNRLMMRALADRAQSAHTALSDTTATLFSYADEVVPLKELLKFLKTAGAGKTKGGLLGTQTLSDVEVTRLATLPSRDVLLSQLAGQLNAPVQGLHYALSWNINKFVYALNAIKEKKTN